MVPEILSADSFRHAKEMVYCGVGPAQDKLHAEQSEKYIAILEATVEALAQGLKDAVECIDVTDPGSGDYYIHYCYLREEGWISP